MTVCFSGFEDSLRKLPAEKIAEFFKLQLEQGTTSSIDWVYRGITFFPQLPERNSRGQSEARIRYSKTRILFSRELREQLESDAQELLRLIAARDKDDGMKYLSFVSGRLLKDPVSDEAISSIKTILTKLDMNELSEALDIVPSNLLTSELFSQLFKQGISRNDQYELIYTLLIKQPVSDDAITWIKNIIPKLDAHERYELLNAMPRHIRIPEFFAAVKDQLFAADTSEYDRALSIYNLILLQETTDVETILILEVFAEVVAKQLNARDSLEFDVSMGFWRTNGNGGTSGRAVAARRLLSIICEQIIDPKTMLSLRSEIDGSSNRARTNSSKLDQSKRYVEQYFNSHDVDNNGIIEGDELKQARSSYKWDTNTDDKIEIEEMLAVIAGTPMPTSINLSSPRSRDRAAKLAKRVLAILANPSAKGQVSDPAELEDFQKLRIGQDIEALKKISKKQSGEFSRFIDFDKRKFKGESKVAPTTEPKKETPPASSSSVEGS